MVIKQCPDDFQVEELTEVKLENAGEFAFYRLAKQGWTSPDALQAVRRRWRIDPRRLSYGGLKDRHARTKQYFTIWHGPRRSLSQQGINVSYLGQVSEPYSSPHVRANRFRLVIRRLDKEEIDSARVALEEVRQSGLANYFDDQRFGSVAGHGVFAARLMIGGEFEEALRLILTAPYAYDRAPQKKEKATLRRHWRDWPACQDQLPRGQARILVSYLVDHPADFRGALTRLHPELRALYLSAYQSHLWNRMLALWLQAHVPDERLVQVSLRLGKYPMPRLLDDGQRAELLGLQLPLPSARQKIDPADRRRACVDAVLQEEGLTLDQLKIKGTRELFFSKGERSVLVVPAHCHHETGPDETRSGKQKMVLAFELPRGCYATLFVKRLGFAETEVL